MSAAAARAPPSGGGRRAPARARWVRSWRGLPQPQKSRCGAARSSGSGLAAGARRGAAGTRPRQTPTPPLAEPRSELGSGRGAATGGCCPPAGAQGSPAHRRGRWAAWGGFRASGEGVPRRGRVRPWAWLGR